MDDQTRFAVCGIDCMSCSIHLRTEEELNYWRGKNADLDEIACDGCRSDRNGCHWSGDCALLSCCIYEKKLDFCGECPDFPCDKVWEWAGQWEHHRKAVEKMRQMKAVGKDNWIRQRLAETGGHAQRCGYECTERTWLLSSSVTSEAMRPAGKGCDTIRGART